MKKIIPLLALFFVLCSGTRAQLTFHDYSAETIIGDTIDFSQYYGKKVMVVNTASKCAYTPQYAQLQQLYAQYRQYNFEIIGFPCNDFANQEPKSDSAINEFCTDNYGVTFQMMSKVEVVKGDTVPVYKWLQRGDLNGVQNSQVDWNFNKYLIDEAGHWVRHIGSATLPTDASITSWITSPSVISSVPEVSMDDLIEIRSANPTATTMDFVVTKPVSKLTISLYATDGRLLSSIYNGGAAVNQAISHPVGDLAAGIYLVRLTVANGLQKTINYAVVK